MEKKTIAGLIVIIAIVAVAIIAGCVDQPRTIPSDQLKPEEQTLPKNNYSINESTWQSMECPFGKPPAIPEE